MLPNTARQAHIFPNIKYSLVSIGALYDSVCTVTFKIKEVIFVYKDDMILRGWINHHNKLWYFPLSVKNKDEQVGDNINNLVKMFTNKNPSIFSKKITCNTFQSYKINLDQGCK